MIDETLAALLDERQPSTTPRAVIEGCTVVQRVSSAIDETTTVVDLHPATVTVSDDGIGATDGTNDWAWRFADMTEIEHGRGGPWTLLSVPGVVGFGVRVPGDRLAEFRAVVDLRAAHAIRGESVTAVSDVVTGPLASIPTITAPVQSPVAAVANEPVPMLIAEPAPIAPADPQPIAPVAAATAATGAPTGLAGIDARNISAWFGTHMVLDRVSLDMPAGQVTALIGPSGCGKSTFLRILNRMHEMIPSAAMSGEVLVDGHDIYAVDRKLTDARREVGMVFQKPNPFPAMSIYDNVLASFRLTGVKASTDAKDEIVQTCLSRAGLWNEVKDRLRKPGGGLSGGQQQRLCIARALAIKPRVLLMDEPCSALDPTSTRRIEETITELVNDVTIVIVTHNMQQAARVSDQCAFFLAEQGTPGLIVEHGPTSAMFSTPKDPRTNDYVNGRFG